MDEWLFAKTFLMFVNNRQTNFKIYGRDIFKGNRRRPSERQSKEQEQGNPYEMFVRGQKLGTRPSRGCERTVGRTETMNSEAWTSQYVGHPPRLIERMTHIGKLTGSRNPQEPLLLQFYRRILVKHSSLYLQTPNIWRTISTFPCSTKWDPDSLGEIQRSNYCLHQMTRMAQE